MSRQNGAELQTRTVEQPQHRFHLGLRLTPFLLLYAVFQQSATGIQAIVAAVNYLHAAQRDVQMSGPVVAQRSHETAVITAVGMLMVHDMTIRLSLWQSADGRSRMQNIQETADARGVGKLKSEVTAQMHNVARPHCPRTFLTAGTGKTLQDIGYIRGHIALFLYVLGAPEAASSTDADGGLSNPS